jgi:phosphoribosylglycinamide formyltransferase-1
MALMRAFRDGTLAADLAVVVANVPAAPVLDRARDLDYPAVLVASAGLARSDHEQRVEQVLQQHAVDHLLLAGYMRILSAPFVARWPGTILNIHPSLLPDFPGLHAVAAQWRAGVRIAGATVHFVDAGVDTGPILLQESIAVRGDEGEAGLAARILNEVEHTLYPRAVTLLLQRLAQGLALPAASASPSTLANEST